MASSFMESCTQFQHSDLGWTQSLPSVLPSSHQKKLNYPCVAQEKTGPGDLQVKQEWKDRTVDQRSKHWNWTLASRGVVTHQCICRTCARDNSARQEVVTLRVSSPALR
jgi:hypothetical protein